MLASLKNTWLFNLRSDLFAGLVERFGVHDKAEAQTDLLQH